MKTLFGPFSQILTMSNLPSMGSISDEDLIVIYDGGVMVENETIIGVGKFHEIKKHCNNIHEIDFPCVLLPGFIDCHTHICYAGSRSIEYSKKNAGISYQKILSEGGGIYDTMEKTRLASDEELIKNTISRLERHFFEGVLTCEVKSGYGINFDQEIRLLKIINEINLSHPSDVIPTCLAAHVPPNDSQTSTGEYLKLIVKELFPILRKENLTNRIDIFIENSAFKKEESKNYLKFAKENDFYVTVHANQFTSGGLHVGVDVGAISVDHLEVITDEEIKYLSNSDTSAVVLPGCSLGLGLPFAPARKLLDNGCKLAIATDWNPGSAPMGDLLTQSSILASNQKLSNAEIFSALSFRSANALGINDRGVIEINKVADLIGFNVLDYREILYNQGKIKPSFICKKGKVYKK